MNNVNSTLSAVNRWFFELYVQPIIGITIDEWRLLDRGRRNALLEAAGLRAYPDELGSRST